MGTQPAQERKNWLAGSLQDVSLAPLLERFRQDPEVKLLRMVGTEENPRLLVVETSEATVERYRQEFGNAYFFEENAPLHPLSNPG